MESFFLIGVNYKSASVSLRENLHIDELTKSIYTTCFPHLCSEFAILATCNRIEIYIVTNNAIKVEDIVKKLFTNKKLQPYVYKDQSAVKHFYTVASGLDSMILGESDILAQIRQSYKSANEKQTIGPILHQLCKEALRIGKRIRYETNIGTGITSIAHAAVLVAKRNITDFQKCHVLIIGAGNMALRSIKNLKQENISQITITNRTHKKAQQLASLLGVKVIRFSELKKVLIDIDLVISVTASPKIILSAVVIKNVMKSRSSRPLYLFDLAVPRDIESSAVSISNVHIYNIDEINKLINKNFKNREKEVDKIKIIIDEEVNQFWIWYYQRRSVPLLNALQNKAICIRDAELKRALQKLEYLQLDENEKNIIASLAKRIEGKLLAKPITTVKRLSVEENGNEYLNMIRELFDLQS